MEVKHVRLCDFCQIWVDDREVVVSLFKDLIICEDCYENSGVQRHLNRIRNAEVVDFLQEING